MDLSIKFVEFLAQSHFSFLEGASSPEELVSTAGALGYVGLGLADLNGLYGSARAHIASKHKNMPFYVGTQLVWKENPLYLFALNRNGYGNLCELLSSWHQSGSLELEPFSHDILAFVPAIPHPHLEELRTLFPKRLALFCSLSFSGQDKALVEKAHAFSQHSQLPCIFSNRPLYHVPERKILQDVLRSIQHRTSVSKAGLSLLPNSERYLKPLSHFDSIFRQYPHWFHTTLELASQFSFSLDEIRYRYPTEWLPEGHTGDSYLRLLVSQGISKRFGNSPLPQVLEQIEHELCLIQELSYADYFLTIWDIVRFAKSRDILFQGRGSAANSIVCYLLGITAIDPIRLNLLFERFISRERHEPPDIDIDFEHERREEVIQYIYERYGRDRAALTAEVICFRKKSALREVGKALEIAIPEIEHFQLISKKRYLPEIPPAEFQTPQSKVTPTLLGKYLTLCQEILGCPRHLGTHVGGFVLSHEKLSRMIPIEKAAMEGRTVVQWDKNDLDNLNFTRVDILGLGILTALRKCFALIKSTYGVSLGLDSIPPEDSKVYEAISQADTLGVFQIESRAQMNMLPRLKPKTFFDLVVQIALVRPGPIQGEMVHPYLRRRQGLEPIDYPHPDLKAILEKTYGVPLFQEQIMKIAMTVAGFSGGEADELRRAMGIWRRDGRNHLSRMGERFREGLIQKGVSKDFADRIFSQIEGFAEYGFPESHAASFALIAYASAYLKVYYPDAYAVALLNSQPMGFYQSHSIIYDAMRHGVRALPLDINFSDWDNLLIEPKVLRLGFREVHGLKKELGKAIAFLRQERPFFSLSDFVSRLRIHLGAGTLTKRDLFFLATGDCFQSIHLSRRQALWEIQALDLHDSLSLPHSKDTSLLEQETNWEKVSLDFSSLGVSLGKHPMTVLHTERLKEQAINTKELTQTRNGQFVKHAGMVVSRQMPPTANGVLFMTLEDEWGLSNLVIWNSVAQTYRDILWKESFLLVEGRIQKDRQSETRNLIVEKVASL